MNSSIRSLTAQPTNSPFPGQSQRTIAATIPCVAGLVLGLLGSPLDGQSLPDYLKPVVSVNAPMIIHETDNSFVNVEAKDHILQVDFDGNTIGVDNYDNAFDPSRVLNGEPTIYYSIVETGSTSDQGYYFIGYYVYHPQDGGASFPSPIGQIVYHGHEHDMEGSYYAIKKNPYSPYGELQVVLTEAHGALIPYENYGAEDIGTSQNHYPAGQTGPGSYLTFSYDYTFHYYRPVVAIRSRTHANYMARSCNTPGGDVYGIDPAPPSGTYIACIHSGTQWILYSPVPVGSVPSSGVWPQRLGPDFRSGLAYYKLVELPDSPIWPNRNGLDLFWGNTVNVGGGTTGLDEFHPSGSDHGGGVVAGASANPPWQWRGGSGECPDTFVGHMCWYDFGEDQTASYHAPAGWPQAPSYGRLLTDPQSEIFMRFPFLQDLIGPMRYNPYTGVSPYDPPAQLSVTIGGDDAVTAGMQSAWVANVTGGTGPYTYQWSGALSGNAQVIQGSLQSDDVLYLDVWDAAAAHISVSKAITVMPSCGQQVIC